MENRYPFPGNMGALLDHAKDRYPHRSGVGNPERMFTFEAYHDRVCRLTHGLKKMGLTRHDRVILSCSDPFGYATFSLAIFRIGAVVVPVNPKMGPYELAHIVKDTFPRFFIGNRENLPRVSKAFEINRGMTPPALSILDEKSGSIPCVSDLDVSGVDTRVEEMAPEDTALIVHTAAMDGYPLGAQLTHGSLFEDTAAFARKSFGDGDRASESLFSLLPLFHSYGFTNGFLVPLMAGVPCVLLGTALRGRTVVKLMETHHATQMVSVPAIFHTLLKPLSERPELCRGLRNLVSGGIGISMRLLDLYREKLGLRISEGYGLTEASPVVTWNGQDRPPKFGTVGPPLPCCRVKIVDDEGNACPPGTVGEVLVSGSNLFSGYFNKPDHTRRSFADGWFRTGDLGFLDDENYLTLTGLKKDMINVFGLKAYPREVERLIMNHPDVTSVSVRGEWHRRYGNMVAAEIRPRPGSTITESAFIEWCRQHMSPYKVPRRVRFI
ncbi:MAG: AMP-binding protein [Deltaproteobacteria bacterium]|nr:AMP-binding protein [Deltaproteobacteria bacterium]